MSGVAPLGGIGLVADPREGKTSIDETTGSYSNSVLQTLHDKNVQFEEYLYYAKISREEEKRLYGPGSDFQAGPGPVRSFFIKNVQRKESVSREDPAKRLSIREAAFSGKAEGFPSDKKEVGVKGTAPDTAGANGATDRWEITEEEWVNASRAARTATWGAVFYLITTDILGPFSTGWAFSQLGWGPAVTLYTVFGALSLYAGYQIWRIFLQMDSDRYPMKDFGDLGFRIFGPWARHLFNILQSFQFFLNVGLIIITSGQSISQMSKGSLCFVVCVLVSAISGCIIGQIRTLARFGWLASLAVFMNLFVMFSSMGVMANSTPNYTAVLASFPELLPNGIDNPPPIRTTGGSPPGLSFRDNVNGLMQAVFSFGGATLFPNLLAEMRRPFDFWKGLLCGEIFIYLAYLIYGAVCYGLQGQYVYNPSYQGVNPYDWQTVANVFELITGIIAACLYGNIGIKVLYNNIGRDLLRFPLLESKRGRWIWVAFVPTYWILAFVIASAIPQVSLFSAFVAAACILQFTYTFPPMLMIGFKSQRDAILPDETFDPSTGVVQRKDHGLKRWIRGYSKELLWNLWDTIFFLGACVTAVLGLYAAIYSMHHNYVTNPNVNAFTCSSPVNG